MDVALFGDERSLAGALAPELLGCRNAADVREYFASRVFVPPDEFLAAGVVLSWSMDSQGAYASFREAHERALSERQFALAACSLERLAQHAMLFGDTKIARAALDDALNLSGAHRLSLWQLRCAAAGARLAIDSGDFERAARLLELAAPHARERETKALLAPIGVALATQSGDQAVLAGWASAELLETALTARDPRNATAATIALLAAALTPRASLATALRRALLQSAGSSEAVELFSLAARYGDIEEARLAAEAPNALVGANRTYIKAHALLARAHLLFRCGERAAGIDHAGDAARAFNAMGMRRWMNEAMMLLVRQENDNLPRRSRGRPVGSALTGREQQVAHLIRRGARNREVAAALQISEHTVERHVSSILGRLGLRSRWQIVDPKNPGEH